MAVKYPNIIGTDFPKYVTDQLEARKKIVEKTNRDSKDLLWLTNRVGWYRVTSGALIAGKDDLAKKNILQGGLVTRGNQEGTVGLREGFDSSYINGPLGFKPMPGITNLSIGTGGRWQTLLQGEIEIIAYDLNQLDIISKLYMSLGIHVFIEWGHKPYIKGDGKNQTIDTSPDIKPLDAFKFKGPSQKEQLLKRISAKKESMEGNYEALLGRVYNFDYNANPDGSYTCKIKVMGAGAMVESLRGVGTYGGKDTDPNISNKDVDKYSSDLENALVSIKNCLNQVLEPKIENTNTPVGNRPLGELLSADATNLFQTNVSLAERAGNFLANFNPNTKEDYYTKPSYGQVLNNIYKNSNYKSLEFIKSGIGGQVRHLNTNASFGNASQIIHEIEGPQKYGLSELNTGFYSGYASTLTYEKTGFLGSKTIKATYITLGHLFCLVQHLGIFVEQSGEAQPAIYLDYNPENTLMKTGAIQASIDPSVCLVPYNGKNTGLGLFLNPLDPTRTKPYPDVEGDGKPNNKKFFQVYKDLDRVSQTAPFLNSQLFRVLVNVDFAISCLKNIKYSKENRTVNIKEYLDKVLDGINVALGKVNNFRVNFVDCSQTLRVVDQNYIPEKINYMTLPVFGKNSIAYDYSYSSKISKNLASQIVIASQAEDKDIKDFPDDVLTYFKLNGGVSDRFTDRIIPECVDNLDEETIENLRAPQSLYDQLYKVYSLSSEDPINTGVSLELSTYFANLQQKYLNKNNPKDATILIPLEMSVTIDGISGILPYNAFLLPNNRLPARYKNRIAFIVFSINHNFNNNQWTTTLRGQTIIRPEQNI